MSTEVAAFDICAALVAADTGAGGLNNSTSPAHLFGGFARIGDPQRTNALPNIEMEVASDREADSFLRARVDLVLRFHVWTDRNTAYRGSAIAGSQDTVIARLRTVLHRVLGAATASGWSPNRMARVGGGQAPADGEKAHYVDTYRMRLSTTNPVN